MRISIFSAISALTLVGQYMVNAEESSLPAPTIDPIYLPEDTSATESHDQLMKNSYDSRWRNASYKLDHPGPGALQTAGSDIASTLFNESLPGLLDTVTMQLSEGANNSNAGNFDPARISLPKDYSVRAYFVSGDPESNYQLGYKETPALGIPFFSQSQSVSKPLKPGDFVDIGTFSQYFSFDFFLISNAGRFVTNDPAYSNPDGLVHAVGLSSPGSSYLLLGFEDGYGTSADRDMNDVVIALEFREYSINSPEPSLLMGSMVVGMFGVSIRRRPSR